MSSDVVTIATPIGTSATYQHNSSARYLAERPPTAEATTTSGGNEASISALAKSSEATTNEIRRILARIEQDNKLLAELERSKAATDLALTSANVEKLKATIEEKKVKEASLSLKPSITIQELEKLMAKLEQDNRILAELDKKRSRLDSHGGLYSANPSSLDTFQSLHHAHQMPTPSPSLISLRDHHHSSLGQHLLPSSSSIPSVLHHYSAMNGGSADEMLDSIDFIELPGRGRCNIYCARYTYDPIKQSPNENPEAELCLSAGDYVIIYGDMDEDGFFNGELLDGRKGLVPSNFVEKLTGEELFDFHATVLYGNRDSDDSSVSFSYAQDMEIMGSEDFLLPEDFHRMNDYVDLDDIEDLDEDKAFDSERGNENFTRGVPPPQRLILERQLNKSILLGWVPPDVVPGTIEAYHVYVDGVPRVTVKSNERTRALIEAVDSNRPHRISVRSVSNSGFHSKDAACTVVVGKDVPLAPTCVRASHVTATSALISWLPSNSNFQHIVAVNSVEVKVVPPGYFRHTVTGLSPNNVYRVSIRVRPGKLLYNDEKNPKRLEMLIGNVEFRTLSKGLPDPPVNVQVEHGPQDGTLLVTWLPVPTQPVSPLVSPVTGYAVFAAGKKIAEVDSPSGDHALIDGCQLLTTNKKCITVRSKTDEGLLSADSITCLVPNDVLRSVQKAKPLRGHQHVVNRADNSLPYDQRDGYPPPGYKPTEGGGHIEGRPGVGGNKGRPHGGVPAPPVSPAPSQRRQDWKEQSYSSRSREGPAQKYQTEQTQMIIDPDENLSDKEIYPTASNASRMSIPSIEITKENVHVNDLDRYSEDDYRRPSRTNPVNSPDDYGTHPRNQPRHRSDPAIRHVRPAQHNDVASSPQQQRRGSSQNHPQEHQRTPQRKSPHHRSKQSNNPSAANRGQPPPNKGGPPGQPLTHSPRPRGPHGPPQPIEQNQARQFNRCGPRMPAPGGNVPPGPSTHNSNPNAYERRRSGGGPVAPTRQRTGSGIDFLPKFDDSPLGGGESLTGSESDNRVRYFVALFDYDPQTMSPNPDAADEELPFQEGQLIQIYGEKDLDGFYRGESNGQMGLVPGNMVSEVQADEDSIPGETPNENVIGRPRTLRTGSTADREVDSNWSSKNVRKMVAIYDYDPQDVSPNVDSEMELAFSVGDVIYVIGEVDEDGFYVGELNGIRGLVPSNFLRDVPLDDDEEDQRPIKGQLPKGQGRSHFGLMGDCRWNWEHRQSSSRGIRLALEDIAASLDVLQRNPTILSVTGPRNRSPSLRDTLPHGTSKWTEQDRPEAALNCLRGASVTRHRSPDLCPPSIRRAGRPTHLELNGTSGPHNGAPAFPDLLPKQQQNDRKGGIFSSFRGIFRNNRKI